MLAASSASMILYPTLFRFGTQQEIVFLMKIAASQLWILLFIALLY